MPRIDANIIVRYLIGEPTAQAESSRRLIERIGRGEITAAIDDITVAEVVWILTSFYHLHREEIASALLDILAIEALRCSDGQAIKEALLLYSEKNIDFVDALLCARMIGSVDTEIYSFDRHFDRVAGVVRREPT